MISLNTSLAHLKRGKPKGGKVMDKDSSCRFCRIYKNGKEAFFQNDYFFAIFDAFPVSPGHVEIIPIRHIESLFDLSEEEWNILLLTIKDVIAVIEKFDLREIYETLLNDSFSDKSREFCQKILDHIGISKKPDGYNIGINEGRAAGRTVDHLHIHIIPRFDGDVEDPVGGIRHIIPGMGNYRK